MQLYGLFIAWNDYAAAQVSMAAVTEYEQERKLQQAEALAWDASGGSKSVSAAKAAVQGDSKVIKMAAQYEKARAYRRMVTEIAERYERDAMLLSRELTRRTSDIKSRRRRFDA